MDGGRGGGLGWLVVWTRMACRYPGARMQNARCWAGVLRLPDAGGYAAGASRSSRRRILPTLVFGSSLRNSTIFGCL